MSRDLLTGKAPASTYRIQFHPGFRFADARDLVPYLNDLGITDLYSSPRFKARRGSSHGYDIVNPMRINSELGTEQDFDELAEKLRHYGMGLLLDVVPNHMAAVAENPWWRDVLENGPASECAPYFDIDWHPPMDKARFLQSNRVLLPYSGSEGEMLRKGFFHSRRGRALWKSCPCLRRQILPAWTWAGTPPLRIALPDTRCPRIELRAAGCTLLPNEFSDVVWIG